MEAGRGLRTMLHEGQLQGLEVPGRSSVLNKLEGESHREWPQEEESRAIWGNLLGRIPPHYKEVALNMKTCGLGQVKKPTPRDFCYQNPMVWTTTLLRFR